MPNGTVEINLEDQGNYEQSHRVMQCRICPSTFYLGTELGQLMWEIHKIGHTLVAIKKAIQK